MPSVFEESTKSDKTSELQQLRTQLLCHPLYDAVQTIENLQLFMREHVFAVWDFMSLLKRLQQVVTCCNVPWLPSADASLARFINEIVLGEESDDDGHGGYSSHFELYLAAMDEVGADARPIREFISNITRGMPLDQALEAASILPSTRRFVRSTLRLTTRGQTHEVAAAFFHGREDVIPDMFSRLVVSLPRQGVCVERMVHYLRRHIELDANDHGPLASKLVKSLCDRRPEREQEALTAAMASIAERISLWDGVLGEIRANDGLA
jgi:hypothetical protein